MTTPSKQHWMIDVLKYSGPPRPNFALGTPVADVWTAAQLVGGLTVPELTQKVAEHLKLKVADLKSADRRITKLVPEKIARRYRVFPIQQDDRHIYVATSEPPNFEAEQTIAFASGRTTVFQLAAPQAIQDAIEWGYSTKPLMPFPSQSDESRLYLLGGERLRLELDAAVPSVPASNPVPALRLALQDSANVGDVPAVAVDPSHILVVDDDSITRSLALAILTKVGYRVAEANDGLAAIESLSQGRQPSLIVLDLDMPRMGGREVLARLKSSAATSGIPVVVFTGSEEDKTEAELMDEGADDYIRKPLEPARFTARVKAVLRRANA